jgi:hypothetical protein
MLVPPHWQIKNIGHFHMQENLGLQVGNGLIRIHSALSQSKRKYKYSDLFSKPEANSFWFFIFYRQPLDIQLVIHQFVVQRGLVDLVIFGSQRFLQRSQHRLAVKTLLNFNPPFCCSRMIPSTL